MSGLWTRGEGSVGGGRQSSTATAGGSGCSSRRGSSPMCWPSRARLMCGPASANTVSAKYSKPCARGTPTTPTRGRLQAYLGRGRLQRSSPLRLAQSAAQSHAQEGFQRWLVVRRSIEDPDEITRLYGLRSRGRHTRSAGEGGREPLAGGDRLRGGQRRGGSGSLRGEKLGRLVPSHNPRAVRPRFPRRHPGRRGDIESSQMGGPKPEDTDSLLAFKRGRGLSWR